MGPVSVRPIRYSVSKKLVAIAFCSAIRSTVCKAFDVVSPGGPVEHAATAKRATRIRLRMNFQVQDRLDVRHRPRRAIVRRSRDNRSAWIQKVAR